MRRLQNLIRECRRVEAEARAQGIEPGITWERTRELAKAFWRLLVAIFKGRRAIYQAIRVRLWKRKCKADFDVKQKGAP